MYGLDDTSLDGSTTPPPRGAAGARRYFRSENLALGLEGTEVPAWLLNAVVNELVNVVQAAGLTPDKADDTQLAAAITRMARPRARVQVTASGITLAADTNHGDLVVCTAAGTVALPAVAAAGNGWLFRVQHAGAAGWVTVDPSGAEQIAGQATYPLAPGEHALIVCSGSDWRVLLGPGSSPIVTDATAGAASVVWSMPADRAASVQRLMLSAYGLVLSGSNDLLLQLGAGTDASPTWITTGYASVTVSQSAAGPDGGGTSVDAPTNGIMLGISSAAQPLQIPQLQLTRLAGDVWQIAGSSLRGAGVSSTVHGVVTAAGCNRVRLVPSGANTVSAGRMITRI